jgi:hypothetical protein
VIGHHGLTALARFLDLGDFATILGKVTAVLRSAQGDRAHSLGERQVRPSTGSEAGCWIVGAMGYVVTGPRILGAGKRITIVTTWYSHTSPEDDPDLPMKAPARSRQPSHADSGLLSIRYWRHRLLLRTCLPSMPRGRMR